MDSEDYDGLIFLEWATTEQLLLELRKRTNTQFLLTVLIHANDHKSKKAWCEWFNLQPGEAMELNNFARKQLLAAIAAEGMSEGAD